MWFDPATISVQSFWSPVNDKDAPLHPRRWVSDRSKSEPGEDVNEGGEEPTPGQGPGHWVPGRLQLGRSPECHDAMWFELEAGQLRDTGVLKVFLAQKAMPLKVMEQDRVFGYSPQGTPHIRTTESDIAKGARGGEALTETWDTVTKFVTVVPR
jgi:hypothetical protein